MQIFVDEYDVLTRWPCSRTGVRFWQDNLVVDGRQMVSLISVHGRGSLFEVYGLLHFSHVPVGFTDQCFSVLRGHWVSMSPKSEPTHVTPVLEQGP